MKKVAIPLKNNKLSPDFDKSSSFLIFTIDKQRNTKRDLLFTHLQSGLWPYWLAKKGVTDLLTKGIDANSIEKLNQFKINVFVGVKTIEPELLLNDYLEGTLDINPSLVEN